jgi:cytidylate kinase
MFDDRDYIALGAAKTPVYQQLPWYDVARCRAEEIGRGEFRGEAERASGPFIALSRQPGSGGSEIGQRLGESLRWPVLDKQLLARIARRYRVDPALLELLDEVPTNLLYEALGHLLNRELISQNAYLSYLRKTVHAAAAEGPAVFVGRGAQYFLPSSRTLKVRVVADESDRVERVRRKFQMPPAAAREFVRQQERSRAAFIERYFHRDLTDATDYDLVVNSSRIGLDGCVDAIQAALRARQLLIAGPGRRLATSGSR